MYTNSKTCSLLKAMRKPASSSKLQIFILLPDGFGVRLAFWNCIKSRIREVIPFLLQDKDYTPQQMLGVDFWRSLNSAENRMVRLCMHEMVRKEELPLTISAQHGKGSVKYQLA